VALDSGASELLSSTVGDFDEGLNLAPSNVT